MAAHALASELPHEWVKDYETDNNYLTPPSAKQFNQSLEFLAPNDPSVVQSKAGVEHVSAFMQTADEVLARKGNEKWVAKDVVAWESERSAFSIKLRAHLDNLIGINQNLGHKYASMGADRNATKHHLITLRASKTAWEIGELELGMSKTTTMRTRQGRRANGHMKANTGIGTDRNPGSDHDNDSDADERGEWWQSDYALRAVQGVLAAQALSFINENGGQVHAPAPAVDAGGSVDHDASNVQMHATAAQPASSSASQPTRPVILKSGYPVFQYQRELLGSILPPMEGRSIDRVEATITPEELYTR